MTDLLEIIGPLRLLRKEAWKYVYASATNEEQLKQDYQTIVNLSIFGYDIDSLITRLDSLAREKHATEKMTVDAMLQHGFIRTNIAEMSAMEGRLLQLGLFFRQIYPDRNEPVHCAIAKCLMIRSICLNKALLLHSNAGNVLELHLEWFLPSIIHVTPTISSPFGLIQIQTRHKVLNKPWYEMPNDNRSPTIQSHSDQSRRSSLDSV